MSPPIVIHCPSPTGGEGDGADSRGMRVRVRVRVRRPGALALGRYGPRPPEFAFWLREASASTGHAEALALQP
jgi:hypothetical protein